MQSTTWPDSTTDLTAKPKLPSFRQVAGDALRKEGWRVMFAGLGPTLIRLVATYNSNSVRQRNGPNKCNLIYVPSLQSRTCESYLCLNECGN